MSTSNASAMAQSGGGRKRPAAGARRRATPPRAAVEAGAELAGFRRLEPEPAAVEMWPLEAAAWLEPELQAALPRSADLRIERRSPIASPVPAVLAVTPVTGRSAPESSEWLLPAVPIVLPEGDLELFGWDARAASKFREAR